MSHLLSLISYKISDIRKDSHNDCLNTLHIYDLLLTFDTLPYFEILPIYDTLASLWLITTIDTLNPSELLINHDTLAIFEILVLPDKKDSPRKGYLPVMITYLLL